VLVENQERPQNEKGSILRMENKLLSLTLMSLARNRMYSYTLSPGGICGLSFLRPSVPKDLTARSQKAIFLLFFSINVTAKLEFI